MTFRRSDNKILINLFLILIILFPALVKATTTHSEISASVTEFLTNHLESLVETAGFSRYQIEVGKLDPRLKLAECKTPLEMKLLSDPIKATRNTIKASCADLWNIIITSKVTLFRNVIVTTQSINRKAHLSPYDLTLQEVATKDLRYGYYVSKEKLGNLVAKRNIGQGQVVTPYNVEGAELIQRGDNVVILATSDILKVKMTGTAMSDGKFGQQILIKNHSSKRMVKGIVTDRGVVKVPL